MSLFKFGFTGGDGGSSDTKRKGKEKSKRKYEDIKKQENFSRNGVKITNRCLKKMNIEFNSISKAS